MPIIEFEGLAENLIPGVKELTDATVKLRSEVAATNDTIKKGAQENIASQQKLGQTIEATAQAMQDLNAESKAAAAGTQGVGKSADEVAPKMTGLVGAIKRAGAAVVEFGKGARDGFREAMKEAGLLGNEADKTKGKLVAAGNSSTAALKTTVKSIEQLRQEIQKLEARRITLVDPAKIAAANQKLAALKAQLVAMDKAGLGAKKTTSDLFGNIKDGVSSAVPGIGNISSAFTGVAGVIGVAVGAFVGFINNFKRLDSVQTFFDAMEIGFDNIKDRLTSFEGFKGLFDPVQQAKDAEFALKYAQSLSDLRDKTREVNVANAEAEKELVKLNQRVLDVTLSQEERIKASDEVARIEEERAKNQRALAEAELFNIRKLIAQKKTNKVAEKDLTDDIKDQLAQRQIALQDSITESLRVTELNQRRKNGILEKGADEAARIAEEEKRRREQAAKDLAQLEEQLAQRSANAAQQTADPAARIELQREQAEAEVRVLEDKLKAANEAVGKGNKLTVDQEVQLADVRLGIRLKYEQDVQALELKSAQDRVALIQDSGEREREAFDLQLKAQIKTLEEAGATEIEIARFVAQKREEFRTGQVNKAIDNEEALALARIDAIKKGAETEEQFRQRIELLKLQTQEEFANQRLEAIKDQTGPEIELIRAQLQAGIAEIERSRAELLSKTPKVDIFSLLGLNLTDEQKKRVTDDLKTIGQAVQDAVIANIASQQQGVQAQLDATEQIIEDQRSRKDELIALLDEELEAQKNGFANNADAVRAEIQAVTDAENAALANRKKLVEEQKKLAAQQAKVESALQIAALLTANAYLLKDGALKGVPGTIAAIAFAISLIGTFASIRAKVRAANADTPAFWEGTTYVDKDRKHRTGRDTVPAMLTRGEAVIPVAPNSKYPKLVEGLVENDFAKMQRAAIEELLTGTGVTLKQDRVREIVRTNEKAQSMTIVDRGPDKALLRRVDELTTLLASFKTQEGSKPTTSSDGGRSVVTTPTRTVKRR